MKGQVFQKGIIILNVYGPNNMASEHTKQKLTKLKGEIDKTTLTVKTFSTSQ